MRRPLHGESLDLPRSQRRFPSNGLPLWILRRCRRTRSLVPKSLRRRHHRGHPPLRHHRGPPPLIPPAVRRALGGLRRALAIRGSRRRRAFRRWCRLPRACVPVWGFRHRPCQRLFQLRLRLFQLRLRLFQLRLRPTSPPQRRRCFYRLRPLLGRRPTGQVLMPRLRACRRGRWHCGGRRRHSQHRRRIFISGPVPKAAPTAYPTMSIATMSLWC